MMKLFLIYVSCLALVGLLVGVPEGMSEQGLAQPCKKPKENMIKLIQRVKENLMLSGRNSLDNKDFTASSVVEAGLVKGLYEVKDGKILNDYGGTIRFKRDLKYYYIRYSRVPGGDTKPSCIFDFPVRNNRHIDSWTAVGEADYGRRPKSDNRSDFYVTLRLSRRHVHKYK